MQHVHDDVPLQLVRDLAGREQEALDQRVGPQAGLQRLPVHQAGG